jgi:hypothetical protein
MELGFLGSLFPWFCNQGNNYFAPMELTNKPHSGEILVTSSVSSVSENNYSSSHSVAKQY